MASESLTEHCDKCPNKDNPDGCPCWISEEDQIVGINPNNGELEYLTGCFYKIVPELLANNINAVSYNINKTNESQNRIMSALDTMSGCLVKLANKP